MEYKIPITISADAHDAIDITNGFTEATQFLLDIGYKSIHIFNEGKWSEVELKPFMH